MARKLRFNPLGALVEVTCRTVHGRLLMRPTPECVDRILGVIGRAQRLYPIVIHALIFLGNHAHFLLSPESAKNLADFMGYVSSNVARKIGPLARWREKFWGRRYTAIVVSGEEKAQIARLRYLLSNSCKEGLVLSPREWPGATSTNALLDGSMRLYGSWLNFTKRFCERRKGNEPSRCEIATPELVILTPLPCWQDLSPEDYQQRILELVEQIESETIEMHEANGTQPLGSQAIFTQDPHSKPKRVKKSPAPAFHAATRERFLELRNAYNIFVVAYRIAADRLRTGRRDFAFPRGCFPPPLPADYYATA